MAKTSVLPQKFKFSEDFAAFRHHEVTKTSVFPQKLKFSEDFSSLEDSIYPLNLITGIYLGAILVTTS